VRVEGANGSESPEHIIYLRPIYKKSDGTIPDILDVAGTVSYPVAVGAVDPVAWQGEFAVNSSARGAIKISICKDKTGPKTCGPAKSFDLPRQTGYSTSLSQDQVLQIATEVEESSLTTDTDDSPYVTTPVPSAAITSGTIATTTLSASMPCTFGVKFCKEPTLLAYTDMSKNGKLILTGSVIDNTIKNGATRYYSLGKRVNYDWIR
jgi:hypothetical protein